MPRPKQPKGKSKSAKQKRRARGLTPELEARLVADGTFAEDLPFDDEKKRAFLSAYKNSNSVARARKVSGTTDHQYKYALKTDPEFARDVEEIQSYNLQLLEDSAFMRAVSGWEEPVFHNGKQCGAKRKFSNALTIFLLKCRKPEVYHLENRESQQAPEEHAEQIIELVKAAHAQFDAPEDTEQDNTQTMGEAATAGKGP